MRKLADNQRFDIRAGRLFIFEIRSDVADVRIGEADNLARIAGVRENFLVSGEAGIENDFATAARNRARGAAFKDAPVFQRERRRSVRYFGQRALPW